MRDPSTPDIVAVRIANAVQSVPTGCWVWQRGCTASGYGRVWAFGRQTVAHRVVYELLVGPVPDGLELDHLCRVPACVNPNHLEPVTHRENALRGEGVSAQAARQTHCLRGHPFDAENTLYEDAGLHRRCRICRRIERKRTTARYRQRPETKANHREYMRRWRVAQKAVRNA